MIRGVKTLIVGIARSGTSALYFKLKQALPETTWCLYEPVRFDPSDPGGSPNVLAKILIGSPDALDFTRFRDFDKKILIVRDPRDNLVSRLLYIPCGRLEIRGNDAKLAAYIDALRGKEADPRSISLRALLDFTYRLSGLPQPDPYNLALDFHRKNDGFVVYKYEDLIARRYEALETYLDVRLSAGEAQVPAQYRHVVRTKAAGNWWHWFTADDVQYFRPRLAPFMAAYGYGDDWALAETPHISPAYASEFVERSVAARRRQDQGLPEAEAA
jgi:hypothetical protein